VRTSYAGAKTFVHVYWLHGKLHRRTLGRWPSTSLSAAREAWRQDRETLAKGDDPRRSNGSADSDTFSAVTTAWLQRDQGANRRVAEVRRILTRDAMPILGDRRLGTISRRDALGLIDAVADRGAPAAARKLHAHLHRLFRWAVGRGIIERNPLAEAPKPAAPAARDRVLEDREITAVWAASETIGWPHGPIVRLLILSGARREEIGGLRWSEIVADEIKLAGSRTKNGEPHVIPLSDHAAEIIRTLPRIGTSDFVFTTTGTTHVSSWSWAKREIDRAASQINGAPLAAWRLHDLRRTVATNLQRLGARLEVIETVLGHSSGSRAGIVGVYQRYGFESETRATLAEWAKHLELIIGKEIVPTKVIVPLRRRADG
jgi:integrase